MPRTKRIAPTIANPAQLDAGSRVHTPGGGAPPVVTGVSPSPSIALTAGSVGADELLRPGQRLGRDRALRASQGLDEVLHPDPLDVDGLRDRRGTARRRVDHARPLREELRAQRDQLRLV